jgi:general transcription factor 3C polypeptide 2
LLNLGIFTVTKRGINLALTISALMFTALQAASLCLVTTPPEHIARAVGKVLSPLGWIGVPVRELTLTVLLALRFMATVFDESRNICLGLASRGIDWKGLGMRGTIGLSLGSVTQVFSNLMLKCGSISQAMAARGFVGPKQHEMYLPSAPGFGRCWEDYGLVMFIGGVVLMGHYV